MGMKAYLNRKLSGLARTLLVPVLMIAAVFILLYGVGSVSEKQQEESMKQIEDAVHKAVLNCYAVEGSYPDSIEYVEDHYGLQIDHDRYDVFYEVFAQNLMPEVTVVERD